MINNNIYEARIAFGSLLRVHRRKSGHTLKALGQLSGTAMTSISNIENGERVAGPMTAKKLADALKLKGYVRDHFLLSAASTQKKDKLLDISRTLAPEIINFLPMVLRERGIDLDQIHACKIHDNPISKPNSDIDAESKSNLLLVTKDGNNIRCCLTVSTD